MGPPVGLIMKTQYLKIEPDQADLIRKVAQCIEQGGIAAIPTETVYGLAARVRTDTLNRLDQVKQRPQEKRYTLHIGDKKDLLRYVPNPPAPARKLVNLAWPGPITIVFELNRANLENQEKKLGIEICQVLYQDSTIGIRCPDLPLCSEILKSTGISVVAPSANPSSHPPATTAQQAIDYFDGKIDLVIDGGKNVCSHKKSSAVVKFGATGIQVLREGVYSNEDIKRLTTVRILFVCTGNSCRSPIAEGLCQKILADKFGCTIDELSHFGYTIESAGLAAMEGLPASVEAEVVCREFGVSIEKHQSRQLIPHRLAESDFIFTMTSAHAKACSEMAGGLGERIKRLDQKGDISDPIGRGLPAYRNCAEQIQAALKERIDELI